MEFAKELFALRRSKGLSQEELAAQVGVSRQAVSKWETAEAMPDLNKLLALSDALEVSLDRLCGRERNDADEKPSAPEKKRHSIWPLLCLILSVTVVLLLWQAVNLYKRATEEESAPVETVMKAYFGSGDGHIVRFRIMPSVVREACVYELLLTPESPVFGAPGPIMLDGSSGVFQGEIAFPLTAAHWSASLRIRDGDETYTIPVATGLYYKGNGMVTWEDAA